MAKCKECKKKDKLIAELQRRIEALKILDPIHKDKPLTELEYDAEWVKALQSGTGDAFDCFGS